MVIETARSVFRRCLNFKLKSITLLLLVPRLGIELFPLFCLAHFRDARAQAGLVKLVFP